MEINYVVVSRKPGEADWEEGSSGLITKQTALRIVDSIRKSRPEREIKVWREITTRENVEINE